MPLTGIDVSRHQGSIDWRKVATGGHTFAFCKATDGVSYKYVAYYQTQAPLIRQAGLVLGAYHWLTARDDPKAQARYFVQTIGDPAGVLCALDVERGTDGSAPTAAAARAFASEFYRLSTGHPLMLYTGSWYWVGVLGNPHGADITPWLWHSEYDTGTEILDGPELDNYGGWDHCTLWQYTSSGTCPGVAGNVDLNIFHADMAALLALAGGATPAPPPEEDDMPVVSIARDTRNGKVFQVVNFESRRHLPNEDRIFIAQAYWKSKGVPDADLQVTDWSPEDLDLIPDVSDLNAELDAAAADLSPEDLADITAAVVAAVGQALAGATPGEPAHYEGQFTAQMHLSPVMEPET